MDKKFATKFLKVRQKKPELNATKILRSNRIANVTKWSNDLISRKITDLKAIQEYFSKLDKQPTGQEEKIVQTILNCKFKEGIFIFKANMFSKPLHSYLFSDSVYTKCLTNDCLNLAMIYNGILQHFDMDPTDYDMCDVESVKIVSENFRLDADTRKGLIQDYSPDFAAICSEVAGAEMINQILADKPQNPSSFNYKGKRYVYYGNEDVCIINEANMSELEIRNKLDNQKYVESSNGELSEGEYIIKPTNDIKYINKEVKMENFCPSYWLSNKRIKFSFYFTFAWDYNYLFKVIEESQVKNEGLLFPANLCYWDSINECFRFLAVLALTSPVLSQDNKDKIINWVNGYLDNKQAISYWKKNQLLFQRCCNDFLNCFLYDSEYSRFNNLYNKLALYNKTLSFLEKHETATDVKNLFQNIPFAPMINQQFKSQVTELAKRMQSTVKNYLEGTNPNLIVNQIKSVAQAIYDLLPSTVEGKVAAFPFICAKGGLCGELIEHNVPGKDPVLYLAQKNFDKQSKKRNKEKKESEKIIKVMEDMDDNMNTYLKLYIQKYFGKEIYDKIPNIDDLISKIKRTITSLSKQDKAKLNTQVLQATSKIPEKISSNYTNKAIDNAINDYLTLNQIKKRKGSKGKKNKSKDEEDDMDVEEEDEK